MFLCVCFVCFSFIIILFERPTNPKLTTIFLTNKKNQKQKQTNILTLSKEQSQV